MLRFIISRKHRDTVSGAEWSGMETIDVECPTLEGALKRGGYGEGGYDISQLIGVEMHAQGKDGDRG